jgi:glycosyltransferase involved in cell wall biosynthesis
MKIVLVSGGWNTVPPREGGGAEAYLFNLAKQLMRMGQEVTVLDRKYPQNESTIEYVDGVKIIRLESARVTWFNFTINFVLTQMLFGLKVIKRLKKQDYQVIHLYTSVLGLVIAFLGGKSIISKMVYGSHGLRRGKTNPGITDRFAYLLENRLVRKSRKTTIANEITAEKLTRQAGVKQEKVQVVPIGVDIEQYNPGLDTSEVQNKYNLVGKRNVLFVGRICVEKGVEYLIKAADILVNRLGVENIQFVLVGPGGNFDDKEKNASPYMTKILQMISDYKLQGIVKLTGIVPVEDLRRLYTACDMVVIPSIIDLDPQVQIEAMASGKPVIGTTVGTMPRRIVDEASGFIIEPANERQLAEKIKYLLDNPLEMKKMGDYARKIVCEKYSAEKMAENMLRVFDDTTKSNL